MTMELEQLRCHRCKVMIPVDDAEFDFGIADTDVSVNGVAVKEERLGVCRSCAEAHATETQEQRDALNRLMQAEAPPPELPNEDDRIGDDGG